MVSFLSTRGSNPGWPIRFCKFYFACAPSYVLRYLPANVHGVAGFGRTPISLQSQLASHCGFPPMFAFCLSSLSSNDNRGVIFFGKGPYKMSPGVDVSTGLIYTPLTFRRRGKYFIGVRSIEINAKPIPLKTSLLAGKGTTRISTTTPFTVLEHSIFVALNHSFTSELSHIPQVKPIPPFPACYERASLPFTRFGPGVPVIAFIMQGKNAVWNILGVNSMVEARPEILCLAFIDGGSHPKDPIVIGAHQFEDNLLQFDVARSRLGFSSSLLMRGTSCSNFNFTSIAPQAEAIA